MNKIVLIDGNNILFRSYYATAYSGSLMKNSKGEPTNALYGLINMLNKIITYCMLSMPLPDDILDWAKENIPNINVPKFFFMPAVKYLRKRYNIEFKDKPEWDF